MFNADVRQNEKVQTELPLRFEGDGERQKKAAMPSSTREYRIEATPRNIPDEIVVNVENQQRLVIKYRLAILSLLKCDIITDSGTPNCSCDWKRRHNNL